MDMNDSMVKLDWLDRVAEFHEAIGVPVPAALSPMAPGDRERRIGFVLEELKELRDAISLAGQADALIDAAYFIIGTMVMIAPPAHFVGGIRWTEWDRFGRLPQMLAYLPTRRVCDACRTYLHWFSQQEDAEEQIKQLASAGVVILRAFKGVNLWPAPLFQIVHDANMAKIGPDGPRFRKTDNKLLKPQDWVDPAPLFEAEVKKQSRDVYQGFRHGYTAAGGGGS